MDLTIKPLLKALADLDKKTEATDEALKDLRLQIHTIFWDLVESKKAKDKKLKLNT